MKHDVKYTFNRNPAFQLKTITVVTRQDQLDMAWLVQAASEGCAARGELNYARQLRADASRLRAEAVNN